MQIERHCFAWESQAEVRPGRTLDLASVSNIALLMNPSDSYQILNNEPTMVSETGESLSHLLEDTDSPEQDENIAGGSALDRTHNPSWDISSIAVSSENIHRATGLDILSVCEGVTSMLENKEEYHKLMSYKGQQAQSWLNLLRQLLDCSLNARARLLFSRALTRLCKSAKLYPDCNVLSGLEAGRDPVAGGSFGDVYKGVLLGQSVSVKVIRTFQDPDAEIMPLYAFYRESIVWSQLRHPNILPLYGTYYFDDRRSRLCLVSPWMEYGNIVQFLPKFPDADRPLLALDIAQGIKYLHKSNMIHGDLKGVNILVTPERRACITDFGLSTWSGTNIVNYTSVASSARGGTARWQAPEILRDGRNSRQGDIYSFAYVCYELFAGHPPFPDIYNDFAVMNKVIQGGRPTRPPSSQLVDAFWVLMKDCWSTDPDDRPSAESAVFRLKEISELNHRSDVAVSDWDDSFSRTLRSSLRDEFLIRSLQELKPFLGHQDSLQRIERIKAILGSRVVHKANYANWDGEEREYKRPCHHETRDQVLRDIDAWIHDPEGTSCLWITGMAGVGKSAIALTAAQCLKDGRALSAKSDSEATRSGTSKATLVAEYFVNFWDTSTSSIESLFPTIAMQLANSSPVAQVVIDDALKRKPTVADSFNGDQARFLFVEPLCAIAEHNPHKLVLVIDGVDEFVDTVDQETLRAVTSTLVNTMSQLPPNVKVVILSRPEHGIATELDTLSANVRQHPLPTEKSKADVEKFLRSELKEYADSPSRRWEGWPDEQQFNELCSLADGHFTCASVAFRWIASELHNTKDVEVRRNEVFDALRRAELTGLNELYGFVLAREILDKSGKAIQFRLDVISSLVLLEEPVPNIGILSALIDAEPRRVLDIIQRTRSLLFEKTEPITEQTVLKPHKSFVNFIINARDKRFPIDFSKNHHRLAEGCFRTLLDPEKLHFNMACIKSLDKEDLEKETTGSDVKPVFAADVMYACSAFLYHVVNAVESDVFIPRLLNFMDNQFLFWLEVLDWDQANRAREHLGLLRDKGNMQTHHQHAQLVDIINDALKFIQHFEYDIFFNPERLASIYFSTIPFAPASSLIANHYRARYPSTLSTTMPHPNNKWDEIPTPYAWIHRAAATDGRHVFVNIEDRIVRCFDAESGAELSSTSIKHDWDAPSLPSALSPDGKLFALGYNACRVWNSETGEEEERVIMKVDSDPIVSLSFSPDSSHIVAGCWEGDILVWNRTSGKIRTFRGHTKPVHFIAYSPDGTHIVSAEDLFDDDVTARVWNISTGACIFMCPGSVAAFSPNGAHIAIACKTTIQVWNVVDLSSELPCSATFEAPKMSVFSLVYSPDGRFLVSGHIRYILIWDISTGQSIATLTGHSDWVDNLVFFPDGKHFISISRIDDTVRVWDIESSLNGQRSETDDLQWDRQWWILNADRQRLSRPPHMPFHHPWNTLVIGKCLPTPSLSPIAYNEEWTKLGELLMHHARMSVASRLAS